MLHIETPRMTVGELADHIRAMKEPVRRSPHVGNLAAKELVIMAGMPSGVDMLLVDTVQGNDRYSAPNTVLLGDRVEMLRSRSSSEGRVVGSLRAADPLDGVERSLTDIHARPFEQLTLNNPPTLMTEFFARYPYAFRVLMMVATNLGEVRNKVQSGGKITPIAGTTTDVYGLDGDEGALISLNGMMAMDMLISTIEGSDATTHLAGNDMSSYIRDPERMAKVRAILHRSCATLGLGNRDHLYRVVDARGLALTTHVSQHHLLESGDTIDIEPYLDMPAGLSDEDRL